MENDFFESMANAIESGELSADDYQIIEETYFIGDLKEMQESWKA